MFESIDNKYLIQPKSNTIVSGKKFLDTYAAKGFTKIVAVDVAAVQGPAGSLVINVSTALPVNPDGGDQVEDAEFVLENVPPTFDDHVTLDAAPPNVPFNEMDCPAHTPFG